MQPLPRGLCTDESALPRPPAHRTRRLTRSRRRKPPTTWPRHCNPPPPPPVTPTLPSPPSGSSRGARPDGQLVQNLSPDPESKGFSADATCSQTGVQTTLPKPALLSPVPRSKARAALARWISVAAIVVAAAAGGLFVLGRRPPGGASEPIPTPQSIRIERKAALSGCTWTETR